MKLFKISQDVNSGYDTYDSAIVAAETEDRARKIHPGWGLEINDIPWNGKSEDYGSWCDAVDVQVEYIGEAKPGTPEGKILSSFNAG